MRAEIIKVDDKTYRLMLGKHELGMSKTDFDARFHLNAINDALEVSFLEGQKYLERMVEGQRMELELQRAMQQAQVEAYEARQKLESLRCRRCGIGIDNDGDGNCGLCAKFGDRQK